MVHVAPVNRCLAELEIAQNHSHSHMYINIGRLAMFGAIGMLAGSYITGKGPLEVMTGGGTVVF